RPEDGLAGALLVDRSTAPGELLCELGICGDPADRRGERTCVAGRHEERALSVCEQLAGGGRVGGEERRCARERLKRLVRDDARRLFGRAEDSERAAGAVQLLRE